MYRIIRTNRLNELDNLASAFPTVRAKCDRLEAALETEQRRTADLTAAAEQDAAQHEQELTVLRERTAADVEEARSAARRTQQQSNALLDDAARRARETAATVRALRAENEELKAKLPAPLPETQGVVARYENLVGAHVDLTLYVTEDPDVTWYKRTDLLLVLLCAGCGYREEESCDDATDCAEARTGFLNSSYEGAKLKRWGQEHAETCRAVALPRQHVTAPAASVPATT
ncbi:hypothetical protein ACFYUH_36895 [Streptomyces fimicarius]|uniref:hypothetical protein n=1 Tax=Streptomyces griseus TaxID=1911 RepID=UPI0036B7B584